MTTALAHMEQLVGIYREVGARPNPVTILMMIASILEEPALRKAAGFERRFACKDLTMRKSGRPGLRRGRRMR